MHWPIQIRLVSSKDLLGFEKAELEPRYLSNEVNRLHKHSITAVHKILRKNYIRFGELQTQARKKINCWATKVAGSYPFGYHLKLSENFSLVVLEVHGF